MQCSLAVCYIKALHAADHNSIAGSRGTEDLPLEGFRIQLPSEGFVFSAVGAENLRGDSFRSEGFGQQLSADERAADALKGAGADEARRFAEEKCARFSTVKVV